MKKIIIVILSLLSSFSVAETSKTENACVDCMLELAWKAKVPAFSDEGPCRTVDSILTNTSSYSHYDTLSGKKLGIIRIERNSGRGPFLEYQEVVQDSSKREHIVPTNLVGYYRLFQEKNKCILEVFLYGIGGRKQTITIKDNRTISLEFSKDDSDVIFDFESFLFANS